MAKWYVKELSSLTGVSVQTLHHYDRISLLKPSVRLDNGYRLYSEQDLAKLQQIIALKFFGFELAQIKMLLADNSNVTENFAAQAEFLEKKANNLLVASQSLKSILADCSSDKSIPWETVIKLIEVYRMTQKLEETWAGKVLTKEELQQYANFESELKTRFRADEKNSFEKNWKTLVEKVKANLDQDPKSEFGLSIAKKCMGMVNGLYGKENANLKHAIWNRGFKGGHMEEEHSVSPEVVAWLDRAMDAYYKGRIYGLLDQVSTNDSSALVQQWQALMEEMYGDAQHLKNELFDVAMTDNLVSLAARKWLQQFYK